MLFYILTAEYLQLCYICMTQLMFTRDHSLDLAYQDWLHFVTVHPQYHHAHCSLPPLVLSSLPVSVSL